MARWKAFLKVPQTEHLMAYLMAYPRACRKDDRKEELTQLEPWWVLWKELEKEGLYRKEPWSWWVR